jgi:hypothetical protein
MTTRFILCLFNKTTRLLIVYSLSAHQAARLFHICSALVGSGSSSGWRRVTSTFESQVKAQIYEVVLGWLAVAQGQGRDRAVAPEQAATMTSWAIYGAAQRWAEEDQAVSAEALARQVLPSSWHRSEPAWSLHSPPNRSRKAKAACMEEALAEWRPHALKNARGEVLL